MSANVRILYFTLWLAHPLLELGIAAFMLKRGMLRQFKFFFGYILTQVLTFAVLYSSYHWGSGST